MCSGGFQGTEVQLSTKADRCTEVKHWYFYHHYTKPMLCAVFIRNMKKYQIIYADPAWSYDDKCLHRGGAERHYRTMNIEDIKNLPVNEIANDDCILFMWATFPKLQEALDVINALGFQYKTNAYLYE